MEDRHKPKLSGEGPNEKSLRVNLSLRILFISSITEQGLINLKDKIWTQLNKSE